MSRIILDLCGGTGAWSRPYAEAGYDVRVITSPKDDVRFYDPPENVWGVLAAPPCTEFALSGARWWEEKDKDPRRLRHALWIVRACLYIVRMSKPKWWALENPVGRLPRLCPELGTPKLKFDPCNYGDPYTKRTCLWGDFRRPKMYYVIPEAVNRIHHAAPGKDRAKIRSITPPGFARAFFEANP